MLKYNLSIIFLFFIFCKNETFSSIKNTKNYDSQHHEALSYCQINKFDETYYILIDLSIHPGKFRFFVYDFKRKTIINQALVTHGSCDVLQDNPNKFEIAKFDSTYGSFCSMKGKYKIGDRGWSKWGVGIKYFLHGLEKSNQTALSRDVVFHSWEAIKNHEIYPNYSPLSQGCPAVCNEFFTEMDNKLKSSKKPILMWII